MTPSPGSRSHLDADVLAAGWLQSPVLWLATMVLGALPLVLPPVAALTDLGGHLGRYAVQLSHGRASDLAQWYTFHWNLVPNLGVDLLVEVLGPLVGLEPAVRVVVVAIPVAQVLGILCLSRSVHGRITPLALFAIPLSYSYSLHFGFVNFALGQALATLALALWVVLARRGWHCVRWVIFGPIAVGLWTCHLAAWALFCVFAGMYDFASVLRGRTDWRTLSQKVLGGTCLLAPQLFRLAKPLPEGGQGPTEDFFNVPLKLLYPLMSLRDRWLLWDVSSAVLLLCLAVWAWRRREAHPAASTSGKLLLGVLIGTLAYLVMPGTILGSSMADMRLVPLILIVALVAAAPVYPEQGWLERERLARLGAGFAALRLLGNGVSLWLAGQAMAADLTVLDSVPRGSRVASIVVEPCFVSILPWQRERRGHIGGYAIARREAFSNEQWVIPGGQLLQVHAPLAGAYATDGSQITKMDDCAKPNTITRHLAQLPRDAFDYVWIIEDGRFRPIPGAVPVRRTPGTVLYRLAHRSGLKH